MILFVENLTLADVPEIGSDPVPALFIPNYQSKVSGDRVLLFLFSCSNGRKPYCSGWDPSDDNVCLLQGSNLAEAGLQIQNLRLRYLRLQPFYVLHLMLELSRNRVLLEDSPLFRLAEIQDELFEINLILIKKIEADAGGTHLEDQHCRLPIFQVLFLPSIKDKVATLAHILNTHFILPAHILNIHFI